YLSHDIVNEMISLMGNALLRSKLHQIWQYHWYAIISHEATDLSKKEQMAICIRWVDKFFEIHKNYIGLVQLDATDAQFLTTAVKDRLVHCMLSLPICRGQAFDGAGNMAGKLHGLTSQIQELEPAALYIHCFAHYLNLCLQDFTHQCITIRNALNICMDYHALVECYQEVNSSHNDEYGRIARGVLNQLEQFKVYFGLRLAHLILSAMKRLFCLLQEGLQSIELTEAFLAQQRTNEAFDLFYESIVGEGTKLTGEPSLQRAKRLPKRLQYFEAFDITAACWLLQRAIENLLILYTNGEENQLQGNENLIPQVIQVTYVKDLDFTNKNVPTLNITKVTKVSTLIDVFIAVPSSDVLFSEVHSLLCLFFTLPVSTATAERSFSALRRLKTFLRSIVTQEYLNNAMLLYVHKSSTDELNMTEIAQEFISV
uniref:HAT C-terminal dimerisation domain-containing protein n=1 Tax=Latimeria chalumnae TaxID=7897 RepID=H3B8C6_LATCH